MLDLEEFSNTNSEFGVELFKKLLKSNPDSNLFFSPFSVALALALTSLGADGNTEKELLTILKMEKFSIDEIHQSYAELVDYLLDTRDMFELNIANKLYLQKSHNFSPDFLQKCQKYYKSGIEALDFESLTNKPTNDYEALINKWVEDQTNGKIKDLLKPGMLSEQTRLIIINAIYFKGSWIEKFIEKETEDGNFFISNNDTVKIPFMRFQEKTLNYYYDDEINCQILELPYIGPLSFIVILPELSKTNLSEVETNLNEKVVQNIFYKLREFKVDLWLPKFKMETTPDILNALKQMGLVDLFRSDKADLSKIDGMRNLFVSVLLHKAFIEVNEKGSEAAAATLVMMTERCMIMERPKPEKITFKADHPFIFLIKDKSYGTILFMGKFMKI